MIHLLQKCSISWKYNIWVDSFEQLAFSKVYFITIYQNWLEIFEVLQNGLTINVIFQIKRLNEISIHPVWQTYDYSCLEVEGFIIFDYFHCAQTTKSIMIHSITCRNLNSFFFLITIILLKNEKPFFINKINIGHLYTFYQIRFALRDTIFALTESVQLVVDCLYK